MTTYVSTQVRGGGHHLLQRMSCNHERRLPPAMPAAQPNRCMINVKGLCSRLPPAMPAAQPNRCVIDVNRLCSRLPPALPAAQPNRCMVDVKGAVLEIAAGLAGGSA